MRFETEWSEEAEGQTGDTWSSLNDEQKQMVKQGCEQSLDPSKLISNDEVQQQFRQWISGQVS